jgi:hypothetical protein
MSNVWATTVLPAVTAGVVTYVLTRGSDRRKFRNEKLLKSLEERRRLYAELLGHLRVYDKAIEDLLQVDSGTMPNNWGPIVREGLQKRAANALDAILCLRPRFALETPRSVRRNAKVPPCVRGGCEPTAEQSPTSAATVSVSPWSWTAFTSAGRSSRGRRSVDAFGPASATRWPAYAAVEGFVVSGY